MVYIYGLFNGDTKDMFYVGRTKNPESRFVEHRRHLPDSEKSSCYMGIIEKGETLAEEDEAFWINYMISIGCSLRNKRLYRKTANYSIAW